MPAKKTSSPKAGGFRIGNLTLGGKEPLFILGPCVIEGEKHLLKSAKVIKAICDDLGVRFLLKASYDKANRTSGTSYRGVGVLDGCRMLAEAGDAVGAPSDGGIGDCVMIPSLEFPFP